MIKLNDQVVHSFGDILMSSTTRLQAALSDLKEGVCSIYIWPVLGWQEVKQRYRRSTLGPFWLTLSTGALIGGMGPLYGRLLNQDISSYFLYLAASFIIWLFLSGLITESCQAFISAEGYIKQTKLPLTVHVLRVIWKNLIFFAHNMVIVVIVMLAYPPPALSLVWLFPVGIALIMVNGLWCGLLLGLLCARFRDIPQIVTSLMQVAMFLTPIFWKADMLGKHQWAATWNPIFHFLEVARAPLLGVAAGAQSWLVVFAVTILGSLVTLVFFTRFRARIAYWV